MGETKIEWAEHVWNPIVGCSVISPGCKRCYAMTQAARLLDRPGSHYEGTTEKVNGRAVWTGKLAKAPDHILTAPLRRRKPTTYFVNSMGDLFHENVPDAWIDEVFAVMALAHWHTFLPLTKRPDRMSAYFAARTTGDPWAEAADSIADLTGQHDHPAILEPSDIPLPNVWLGTSAEDEERYRQRWQHVAATPAAVRFLSYEPGLGPISDLDLGRAGAPDWVIIGGESGRGARPFGIDWARSIVQQCRRANVPAFVKQLGSNPQEIAWPRGVTDTEARTWMRDGWTRITAADGEHWRRYWRLRDKKGGDISEWPADLRIREFPDA